MTGPEPSLGMDDLRRLLDEHGEVDALLCDDRFHEHMAQRGNYGKHEVSLTEVLEVLDHAPRFFLNRGGKSAPVIMIGPTFAERMLTVPVVPTDTIGVWRPLTAFESNAHDRERYGGGQS